MRQHVEQRRQCSANLACCKFIRRILVRSMSYYTMIILFLLIFILLRHALAIQAKCPITIEEMVALMNISIEYVVTQKGTQDLSRFKPTAKTLLDKYLKFQRISTQLITHFLPRMGGEHPDFIVKWRLQEPYDPKQPNALGAWAETILRFPLIFLRGLRISLRIGIQNLRLLWKW